MSRIKLGSIKLTELSTPHERYIGSVLNTFNGYLLPRIIDDPAEFRSVYGEFPYNETYIKLIKLGYPILCSPLISPISQYNRSSLRLNKTGSHVLYCHPKIDKDYQWFSYGQILTTGDTIIDKNRVIELNTNSRYPLPVSVHISKGSKDKLIDRIVYTKDSDGIYKILISLNKSKSKYNFNASVEDYPSFESNCFMVHRGDQIPDPIKDLIKSMGTTPDITLLDKNGILLDPAGITINNATGEIHIDNSDWEAAFIRVLPGSLMRIRDYVLNDIQIHHDLESYPTIKSQSTGDSSLEKFDIKYTDKNNLIITYKEKSGSHRVSYNVTRDPISEKQIKLNERIYNTVLDLGLTNLDATDDRFFTLLVGGMRYLFYTGEIHNLNVEFYDKLIQLSTSDKSEIIDIIKETLIKGSLSSNEVITPYDEVNETLHQIIKKIESDQGVDFRSDNFESWFSTFRDSIRKTELVLSNIRDLLSVVDTLYGSKYHYYHYLNHKWLIGDPIDPSVTTGDLIDFNGEKYYLTSDDHLEFNQLPNNPLDGDVYIVNSGLVDSGFSIDDLLEEIRTSYLIKDKLLIKSRTSTQLLNYMKFDNIIIKSNFNLNQDTLCELTEKDKLIEFYSKIAGKTGSDIGLVITKDPEAEFTYDIEIKIKELTEYFKVTTDRSTVSIPHISSINQQSKLVSVKLYDYVLDGFRYDQEDIEITDFNPNNVIPVELPVGSFKLDRFIVDHSELSDYRRGLDSLCDTDLYPDLFIVPELWGDKELRSEQVELVSDYINSANKMTQALIKVEWFDLINKIPADIGGLRLINPENRISYFYSDIIENGISYPVFLYYIRDLLSGEFLRIPTERVNYNVFNLLKKNAVTINNQPYLIEYVDSESAIVKASDGTKENHNLEDLRSITELLDNLGINYLEYNNLYYYYRNIHQNPQYHWNFIVQYCISMCSREILRNKHQLIASHQQILNQRITSLLDRLIDYPYIKNISSTASYSNGGRGVLIKVNMKLIDMVNKLYTINFDLTINK